MKTKQQNARTPICVMISSIVSALTLTFALSVQANELPQAAQNIVDSYFSALQAGDTQSLAELATGRLKTKGEILRNNGDYALQLQKDNESRTFEVVKVNFGDSGLLQIDYNASHGPELVKKRLSLMETEDGTYLIFADQVLP